MVLSPIDSQTASRVFDKNAVTFITERGEVNEDSEASPNSALKTLSRGMQLGLFDFSINPHRDPKTKSVGHAVHKSDAYGPLRSRTTASRRFAILNP
jgi:hypothetical protein